MVVGTCMLSKGFTCVSHHLSQMYNSEGLSPCEMWEWVSQLCPSEVMSLSIVLTRETIF